MPCFWFVVILILFVVVFQGLKAVCDIEALGLLDRSVAAVPHGKKLPKSIGNQRLFDAVWLILILILSLYL